MNVWILTHSEQYYPMSGTGDWISVHFTQAEAEAALAARKNQDGLCLIHIKPNGSFSEVRR